MVVSVTRLRLRGLRFLVPFSWHATKSFRQATAASGNVTATTRRVGLAFWTLTGWRDEASLKAYMLSGAHGRAMPKLREWCDEAATARVTDSASDVDWERAEVLLAERGRLHPVRYPSPAHAAGRPLGSDEPPAEPNGQHAFRDGT